MAGKKKGLYANINAKKKAGKKPRRKGAKGAPTDADFKWAAKTAKKEVMDIRAEVINKLRAVVSVRPQRVRSTELLNSCNSLDKSE